MAYKQKLVGSSKKGDSPFSVIIIAALVVIGVAIIGGSIISGISSEYNQTVNDTSYVEISNSAEDIVNVVNGTSNTFYGNKSSTSTSTAVDSMVGSAYSSMLVIGSLPSVFGTVIDVVSGSLGISESLSTLMITGVMAIIVGIALWLAVGRR